tara:strand:+ start:300 stop:1505 length:1206 start_codon:yes stop_codon:yes gene_type:complete
MAIIPASRGVVFYDPTHRLYQTSYQANANLTDFSYTMQDIIDTVTNSVVENTSAVANYIIPVNRNSEASRALSETVKEGEVVLIFPVTAFSSNNSSYYNFTAFANIQDPIIPGLGLTVKHPPIIINKTNYSLTDLFGNVGASWGSKDPISIDTQAASTTTGAAFDMGSFQSGIMLKGLWEVTVSVDIAVFTGNLYDDATSTPAPMNVMVTLGGGQDDDNYLLTNDYPEHPGNPTNDMTSEESVVDAYTFTSDYAFRTMSYGGNLQPTWGKGDFFIRTFQKTFLRNNWSAPWWSLFVYARGGALNPSEGFSTKTVYLGMEGIHASNRISNASTGTTDIVRVNGVTGSTYYYNGVSNRVQGSQMDFIHGGADGPGWVVWKWLGATPPPATYYYDGDGIGLGNL